MKLYDVIGIGFGPANLAFAIAMQEQNKLTDRVCFIEKQADFLWHGGMLLDGASMQISFLKDLVSLRNPSSHFSFVNYLHQQGRLDNFINLKTFYPSRIEFNDYLRWAASHFQQHCHYAEQVLRIEPVMVGEQVDHLRVISISSNGEQHIRLAKDLVIGAGGRAKIPAPFDQLLDNNHIWHSSTYLQNKGKIQPGDKVAVLGAGQSAAEICLDLLKMPQQPQVDLIMRAGTLKPADSSPFVNEIFSPAFTNVVFAQNSEQKQRYFSEFRNTNYSVVDEQLITAIYQTLYQQKLQQRTDLTLRTETTVSAAVSRLQGVALTLSNNCGRTTQHEYQHVVLATGYQYPSPPTLLNEITPWLKSGISRDYQLETSANFQPKIFTQGVNEPTHGISDSLLSVLAIRSAEIATAIVPAKLAGRGAA
jgi:lysine/ornithine N-monooxygenase